MAREGGGRRIPDTHRTVGRALIFGLKARSSVIMPVMLYRRRVRGGGSRDGDSIKGY